MSSKLQGTSLRINDTQEIAKIKTSVNNRDDEVPTSKAVKDLIDSLVPETLDVEGEWTNKQVRHRIPDPAGLSFKVTYKNGDTAYVGARLVSPEAWPDVGSQTATFSYTENGITIYGTKNAGINLLPVLLTITGDWANYQYAGSAPDPDGLTFTVTYDDDSPAVVSGLPVTPEIWGNTVGLQTATFSYTENGATVTATKDANVVRKPISLVVTGDWGNQYKNCSPDLTGLNFRVNYSNGSYETIEASRLAAVTPNIWEDIGEQTATFYYTENGETVTTTKDANVVRKPESLVVTGEMNNASNNIYQYTLTEPNLNGITSLKVYYKGEETPEDIVISDPRLSISPKQWSNLANQQLITFTFTDNEVEVQSVKTANVVRKLTGLSVGGSWSKTQYTNTAVDYTGLTFTASYNNNTTATVTPSVSPNNWSSTVGTQTATFSYTENNITVSESKSATVKKKPTALTITGSWSNTQYINTAVNYTGLTFTASYNNGTTATVTPSSYSPTTWSSTAGTQTATFSYTENGITVSASSSVNVVEVKTVPLTLQAREAGNISITKKNNPGTIYYSKNGGSQTVLDSGVNIPVNAGDKVSFYRTISGHSSYSNYFTIKCTNNCYVYGNIMSLYNKDNFTNLTTIEYTHAFIRLFNENTYINIDESVGKLVLPATTLAIHCYGYMFYRCTGLTSIPSNLLPATTLAASCYYDMFYGCTSLTTAPTLPATTLANSCYYSMFRDCSSLTTAPTLPATTLADYCYESMFQGCSSLTTITCLATNVSAGGYNTKNWVEGVASSGTFYKNSAMSSWSTSNNGITSRWTVRNA